MQNDRTLPSPDAPSAFIGNGASPRWATLMVATCNVLNLAQPGRHFYDGQDPYSQTEFDRKVDWLGNRFKALNADVIAVQEVWDELALRAAVARSGLQYSSVVVPGAENGPGQIGAQGTPRVGIVTRLKLESVESIVNFPAAAVVQVPGLGAHTRFERPPLVATLRMKHGQPVCVITAHLKSKRPKYLEDASGKTIEDTDDPAVQALGSLRSLIMRASEALALRLKVVELLHRTRLPLVLMGDLNDGPHSVTTQLIAATSQVAYDKGARDNALFSAWDVQGDAALRVLAVPPNAGNTHDDIIRNALQPSEGKTTRGNINGFTATHFVGARKGSNGQPQALEATLVTGPVCPSRSCPASRRPSRRGCGRLRPRCRATT